MFDPVAFDRQVPEVVARLATTRVEELSIDAAVQLVVDAERVISWASAVQAAGTAWLAGSDATGAGGVVPMTQSDGLAPVSPQSSDPLTVASSDTRARADVVRDPLGPDGLAEWCAEEVAVALHATRARAGHLVAFACELAHLPATYALLRDGLIDVPRARVLTDALTGVSPHLAAAIEQAVLPDAPETTSGKLRAMVTRQMAELDAQGVARRNRAQRADRAVVVYPDPASATSTVCARGLDAADARAVWESLDAIAHAGDRTRDPRGLDARRADAFVALLTGHDPLPDWATPAGAGLQGPGTERQQLIPLPVGGLPAGFQPTQAGSQQQADPRRRVSLQLIAPAPLVAGAPAGSGSVGASGAPRLPHPSTSVARAGLVAPASLTGAGLVAPVGAARTKAIVTTGLASAVPTDAAPTAVASSAAVTPAAVTPAAVTPAWLSGYGWLTPPHAWALVAQAAVRTRWAIVDATSGVLRALTTKPPGSATDAGAAATRTTAAYRPPPALATLVQARDLVCRFPGCRQPAHRADLDHLRPWPVGPTIATNMWALCRRHHRLKHSGRWKVQALTPDGTDGAVQWTSASGITLTSAPPRYARRE